MTLAGVALAACAVSIEAAFGALAVQRAGELLRIRAICFRQARHTRSDGRAMKARAVRAVCVARALDAQTRGRARGHLAAMTVAGHAARIAASPRATHSAAAIGVRLAGDALRSHTMAEAVRAVTSYRASDAAP